MTRERIEDMREVVLPFVTKRLMETNYENLGESDAKEFAKDFNKILALAIKGLEQEPNCSEIPTGSTTKNDLGVDREDAVERLNALKQFIGYDKDSEIVKATQKSFDMAISALEHPERNVVAVVPCGDAISRSDVLKLMQDNWHTHNGDWAMQESMDDIRALPSITPQEPRWIPCSEKKPNKGGEYLLWGKIDESEEEDYCFIGDYHEFDEVFGTEISNYDPKTLGFLDTEIEEYYSVVAWMPLPKPYEPQEGEGCTK